MLAHIKLTTAIFNDTSANLQAHLHVVQMTRSRSSLLIGIAEDFEEILNVEAQSF